MSIRVGIVAGMRCWSEIRQNLARIGEMRLFVVIIMPVCCSGIVLVSGEEPKLNHESDDGQGGPCGGPDDGGLVEEIGA